MKATKPKPFVAFVETVCKVRLEAAQRVWARVAIDRCEPRDLPADEREIARSLFGDVDVVPESARDIAELVKGARIGGSWLSALYALWRALTAPLDRLAAGELAVCLVVAPDLRLARQTLRYAVGAAKKIRGVVITSETADGFIVSREGGRSVSVECLPATRGGSAVRGRTLLCAILSEAALFRDDNFLVNDRAIFEAASPRVVGDGLVIIESTPWAEGGLLFELWRDNFGAPRTALVAVAPTRLVRTDPRVLREVDREYERDPENAEREFGAKFSSAGSSAFFDQHALDASRDETLPHPAPRRSSLAYFGAVDLAYRKDCACAAVSERENGTLRIVATIELRPTKGAPLKPSEVYATFAALFKEYGVTVVYADSFGREEAREGFAKHGIHIEAPIEGAGAKSTVHVRVRELVHEGRVRFPASATRLLNQLKAIVSRPVSGGGLNISTPRRGGAHGDVASAAILALWAAGEACTEILMPSNAGGLYRHAGGSGAQWGSTYSDDPPLYPDDGDGRLDFGSF